MLGFRVDKDQRSWVLGFRVLGFRVSMRLGV